jgi:hypothetical protein
MERFMILSSLEIEGFLDLSVSPDREIAPAEPFSIHDPGVPSH